MWMSAAVSPAPPSWRRRGGLRTWPSIALAFRRCQPLSPDVDALRSPWTDVGTNAPAPASLRGRGDGAEPGKRAQAVC